jgi:hypothetical protein
VTELEGLVVGVTGKRGLWVALRHIVAQEPRLDPEELDGLIGRAEVQLGDLEELRLRAFSEAAAAAERV